MDQARARNATTAQIEQTRRWIVILTVRADWYPHGIPEPDKSFLEQEVRRLLRDCARVMRYPYPEMPADPVDAFTGHLLAQFYWGPATPWNGSGNYVRDQASPWGFWNPNVRSELHISWFQHFYNNQEVIQFEGRNFWNDMLTGRGSFAHPLDGCPLIDWIKSELLEQAYHSNRNAPAPDVRLRHVSNLEVDL
jgi:hypothetical protein